MIDRKRNANVVDSIAIVLRDEDEDLTLVERDALRLAQRVCAQRTQTFDLTPLAGSAYDTGL